MKAPCARRWLAMALAGLVLGATPGPARAHAGASAAPQDQDAAQAQAEVDQARTAARAGDYTAAIEHFEKALKYRPSAKVHFNIGVCHHRLMAAAPEGSPAYQEHRGAAVDAYNRYLQAAPEARDRDDVSAMIRALGGTPLSAETPEPWSIDLVEPDAVPDPPGFEDELDDRPTPEIPDAEPVPQVPGTTGPLPILVPRWELGAFVPVSLVAPAQLAASQGLRPVPTLGLGLRGHGYLGARRLVRLGGELALTTQAQSARAHYRLSVAYVTLVAGVRNIVGSKERWELGAEGSIGLGSQTMIFRGEPRLVCSANGRTASQRTGMWAGARMVVAALLGTRRTQAIELRVGPGVGAFGPGTVAAGEPCEGSRSAFEIFGLGQSTSLVVTIDLGYAARF